AHLGLPVHRPFTGVERRHVQGAARPAVEVRAVQQDAGAVVDPGHPVAVVVAPDRPADGPGLAPELPLVAVESVDQLADPHPVGLVGEVRAERAAAVTEVLGVLLQHPLAAVVEDAAVGAHQERGVEHPGVVVVFEADPLARAGFAVGLVTVSAFGHGGRHYRARRAVLSPGGARSPPWPVSSTTSAPDSKRSPRSWPIWRSSDCGSPSTPAVTSCRSTNGDSPGPGGRSTRPPTCSPNPTAPEPG